MMIKQRKNFENSIFWNAKHNLREKGLIRNILSEAPVMEEAFRILSLSISYNCNNCFVTFVVGHMINCIY